jgi:hypothetical protein
MLAMVRRRAFRLLRERVPRQLCNRLLHNCRGDGLLPHGFSPVLRLAKVCRIFVANSADCAGFCADSATSKCCVIYNLRFKSFHERETTIDLILAGSDLFSDTYTLAKILWGPFCGRPLKVQ